MAHPSMLTNPCDSPSARMVPSVTVAGTREAFAGGEAAARALPVSSAAPPRHDIASLDGLRAVSVLIVFMSHAGLGHVVPGGLGVTVFFFLSGFLITTLLRREWARTGTLSITRFYLRRVLRLAPPLLLTLAISYGLVLGGWLTGGASWQGFMAQVLYFANYYALFFEGANSVPQGTGVLWSLAVEEHFYLVYPLLFLWLARARPTRAAAVLTLLCLAALAWRIHLAGQLGFHHDRTYYASDTRMDSILWGCILALVANPLDPPPPADPSRPGPGSLKALLVGLVLLGLTLVIRNDWARETIRYTMQGVALMPIFHLVVRYPRHPLIRPLNWPWVRRLGVYSYAIYLIHHVVIRLLESGLPAARHPVVLLPLALGLSVLFAVGVERLLDARLRGLRARLR